MNYNLEPRRSHQILAYVASIMTIIIAGYFAISGIVAPETLIVGGGNYPTTIVGLYVSVRSITILSTLAYFMIRKSWRYWNLMMLLNGIVQLGDAYIGFMQNDLAKAMGPLVLAILLLYAAVLTRSKTE